MYPYRSRYILVPLMLLLLGISACFSMPRRPPKSYVMDHYDSVPVERVLVIPPTGGPPEEADSLTMAMVQLLRLKNAFEVTVYSVGQNPELDNAVIMAHRNRWAIPTDVIRQIGANYLEHDAVLTIYEATGPQGLSYRTMLTVPSLAVFNHGAVPFIRGYRNGGARYLTSLNPVSQAFLHLRLFDIMSGDQLWKVRIEHGERGNTGRILRRLPEDYN